MSNSTEDQYILVPDITPETMNKKSEWFSTLKSRHGRTDIPDWAFNYFFRKIPVGVLGGLPSVRYMDFCFNTFPDMQNFMNVKNSRWLIPYRNTRTNTGFTGYSYNYFMSKNGIIPASFSSPKFPLSSSKMYDSVHFGDGVFVYLGESDLELAIKMANVKPDQFVPQYLIDIVEIYPEFPKLRGLIRKELNVIAPEEMIKRANKEEIVSFIKENCKIPLSNIRFMECGPKTFGLFPNETAPTPPPIPRQPMLITININVSETQYVHISTQRIARYSGQLRVPASVADDGIEAIRDYIAENYATIPAEYEEIGEERAEEVTGTDDYLDITDLSEFEPDEDE